MENHTDHIVAEIEYLDANRELVHSDIGPYNGKLENLTPEHRKFLHDNLDEWLDRSSGTGIFYITGQVGSYFKLE